MMREGTAILTFSEVSYEILNGKGSQEANSTFYFI